MKEPVAPPADKTDPKYYDAAFENYSGKKRFTVQHPKHRKIITVMAPSFDAAIVAAATYWKTDWTRISFYADCVVHQTVGG